MITDFRIKFWRFFRKNKLLIFIIICIIAIIMLVNHFLKSYEPKVELQTTYEPHTSVMDDSDTVPTKTANTIESMIDQYVGYCNSADYASAYNMLSDKCKEKEFGNNFDNFRAYVYTKMPNEKKYAIQDYSNDGNLYIYQIKYTDDLLATGLTNSTYQYTEEKIVFKKTSNGIEMSIGNFIDYKDINNISENQYLKIDVESVTKYYSIEQYKVRLSNRSNYTIVIADGKMSKEVALQLKSGDLREPTNIKNIVLKPGETREEEVIFTKFYDNDNDADNLVFDSIRVMENYSGVNGISDDIINSEIQNAIAKFSISISVSD